ncbi:MAG: DUF2877 domain-containing protein [Bacteroidetes bacterium]|nr:DUF2877 domain-containing protein [Bacteroidota bacterium]
MEKIILGDLLPQGAFIIHSTFKNVCNFINANSELIFITNLKKNISANSIYIDNENIAQYTNVLISENSVFLNDVNILPQTEFYDSKVDYSALDILTLEINLQIIPNEYNELFAPESMLFVLLAEKQSFFKSGFDSHFMKNSLNASEIIKFGEIVEGVKMLKGTGKGLTPSGDDFIAGMLYGLHFNEFKHQKPLANLRNKIYNASIGKNPLSNSFLLNAKNGNCFYLLKNFVYLASQSKLVSDNLNELFSMGATSGADLLSGYIFSVQNKIGI